MDEPGLVGVLQSLGRLPDVVGPARHLDRPVRGHVLVQVQPVHVFHHHERRVAGLVHVEDADDVPVVERSHRPGFTVEPLDRTCVWRRGPAPREDLHRHQSLEDQVFAQEHLAHAPGPEVVEDLVLVGEEEALVPAVQQLPGLERGEQAIAYEPGGKRGSSDLRTGFGTKRGQPLGGKQATRFERVEERGSGCRGVHIAALTGPRMRGDPPLSLNLPISQIFAREYFENKRREYGGSLRFLTWRRRRLGGARR